MDFFWIRLPHAYHRSTMRVCAAKKKKNKIDTSSMRTQGVPHIGTRYILNTDILPKMKYSYVINTI
jgi:hypothetical protein